MAKRIKEIDFLYTLGTILVVFGHSHSSDWTRIAGTSYEIVEGFIYSFHMPLFFFLSGYLFMNSGKIERIGYGKWIAEKALKILIPYAFLTTLFLIPKMYFDTGKFFDAMFIVKSFLQPRNNVWGHLWFLPVLFFCFVVFGMWKLFLNEKNRLLIASLATIICIVLYFVPLDTEWLGFTDLRRFIVFFDLGIIVFELFHKRHLQIHAAYKSILMIIGITSSVLLYVFLFDYPAIKLLIAILMILTCCLSATIINENSFCQWISQHNYTIYLYSWPAQFVVMMMCDKLNTSWPITFLMMFLIGFICPILIILIYEKLPKLHNRAFDLFLGVK